MSSDWFTLGWSDKGVLLLDQRVLPEREVVLVCGTLEEVARAIEDLAVRGAPAIGCTAALGMALAARESAALDESDFEAALDRAHERLAATRPTAVNLFWALDRMAACRRQLRDAGEPPRATAAVLLQEALAIVEEDADICRALGHAGAALVPDGARVLTHCNAGALATAGYGTALGVVRAAVEQGRKLTVLADETRPFLQGARLTAWELHRDGIPVSVITDNMSAHMMQQGEVDLVLVGADRVAANGDVANKIGTYGLAVLARAHDLPFYVAAPCSTIDPETACGADIPIEERGRREVAHFGDRPVVPDEVPVRHPAFDITPAEYVTALITERGVVERPDTESIAVLLRGGRG